MGSSLAVRRIRPTSMARLMERRTVPVLAWATVIGYRHIEASPPMAPTTVRTRVSAQLASMVVKETTLPRSSVMTTGLMSMPASTAVVI